MRKGSLKSKFLWLTLLVILVPLLVTNSVAISMHNDLLRDSMRTLAYHNIQHVGLTMQIFVQTANELSTDMIGNETIRAYLLAAEEGDDPEAAARAQEVAEAVRACSSSARRRCFQLRGGRLTTITIQGSR